MNPRVFLASLILFACSALFVQTSLAEAPSQAPTRFEITPFGGYRLGGSLNLDDPSYSELDIDDNGVYGLALGMKVAPGEEGGDASVELMWTHQNTSLTALPNPGAAPASLTMHVDQFHFNGLYAPPGFDAIRPYMMAGLGATHFSPTGDESSLTLFSWALGGGVKVPVTHHLGLRFEAKWDPVVQLSSTRVFCNSATGQCFVSSSKDLIDQVDFTAGLTVGF